MTNEIEAMRGRIEIDEIPYEVKRNKNRSTVDKALIYKLFSYYLGFKIV